MTAKRNDSEANDSEANDSEANDSEANDSEASIDPSLCYAPFRMTIGRLLSL